MLGGRSQLGCLAFLSVMSIPSFINESVLYERLLTSASNWQSREKLEAGDLPMIAMDGIIAIDAL